MVVTDALWSRLRAAIHVLFRSARASGALEASVQADEQRLALLARFPTGTCAPLSVDVDRSTATVCASFGLHQSISDYPLEARWLLELLRAATGEWEEQTIHAGPILVQATTNFRLAGKSASFAYGVPGTAVRRMPGLRTEVVAFHAWTRPRPGCSSALVNGQRSRLTVDG